MSSAALAWLTIELAEKVLKNSQSDDTIEVTDLTTKPAVANGDNYGSEMIRCSVKYSSHKSGHRITETKPLIVKISPIVEGATKELLRKFEAFEMEINMMQTTLEEMNEILDEKDYRLNARALYAETGDPSFIVLEDLTPLGYRMADRLVGLDLEHCLLAMRNLAKFHASSVALSEKGTDLKSMYKKGIFGADYPEDWKNFILGGMKTLAKELLNWPELGTDRHRYSEEIFKLSEECYDKAVGCVNQKSCEFNVLNHGDCWLNNMLFRYDDEGKLKGHIFVDFQLPLWNSPAIDLLIFLNTSPSEDVECHNREDLLKEYLNTLTKTMTKLRCKTKPPTMDALEKTLKDYEFYGVVAACVFLPVVLLDKSEAVSFNDMQTDEYSNPAYKGQAYRKRMLKRLAAWNADGFIQI